MRRSELLTEMHRSPLYIQDGEINDDVRKNRQIASSSNHKETP
jgi:hypothetical protein